MMRAKRARSQQSKDARYQFGVKNGHDFEAVLVICGFQIPVPNNLGQPTELDETHKKKADVRRGIGTPALPSPRV